MRPDSPGRNIRRMGGFTLMEVLIAMVVLSIGLLGLAGLQAAGLRNNHSAYLRSQATILAYDMADRVRANLDHGAGVVDPAHFYDDPTPTQNANCVGSAGCTQAQMAQHDAYEWTQALAAALPSGQGVVCLDSTPADGDDAASPECDGGGNLYAIKVWWDDDRDGSVDDDRFVVSFRP